MRRGTGDGDVFAPRASFAPIGNQAVFCQHQGQAPIDDPFAGKRLFQIPDLLMPKLKGEGGAGQPPVLALGEGTAVKDIQPKAAPQRICILLPDISFSSFWITL